MRQKLDSHRRNSIYSLPSSPPIHHPGRVEACELNHYALESRRRAGREVEEDGSLAGALNGNTNTRKNRHEIGAGVYYTHSKHTYGYRRTPRTTGRDTCRYEKGGQSSSEL